MSKTVTQTILDPSKQVHHTTMSSEHDQPQHFDKDGNRIAYVDIEVPYKPEYDFETRDTKHWWYKNESTLYFDVYTKVATFRSRTTLGKYWAMTRRWLAHKYIWRFL